MLRVAVRVDASPVVGLGHVMRCRRLADALMARGATVRFIMNAAAQGVMTARDAGACEVVWLDAGASPDTAADARATLAAMGDGRWDWLVVDHYGLGAAWERAVGARADRVLVIDDLADRAHACDVLVDVNHYVDAASRYTGKVPDDCTLLLGPRYALLDPSFAAWREKAGDRSGPVHRLFVGFGGGDSDDYTGQTLDGLAAWPDCPATVDVVIGRGHPTREAIERRCAAQGYTCHVQSQDVAALMAQADLAIGGGGSMTWERCCVGVPAVAFVLAPNQAKVVADGAAGGLLYAAPDGPDVAGTVTRHVAALAESGWLRRRISEAGRAHVDGQGVRRVVQAMTGSPVVVGRATGDDAAFVFGCRNDPATRAMSRETAPLVWDSHLAWFTRVLADDQRLMYIGRMDGEPVGVVRFDVHGADAEVSISVAPGQHGRGMGAGLLAAAEAQFFEACPSVARVVAVVREANRASHALFAAAAYEPESRTYVKHRRGRDV